jgi:hypothetical protein
MCEATNNLSIEELDVRSLDLAHEKICERIEYRRAEVSWRVSAALIRATSLTT